jgi:2',3'-cyclic-nucleotide 2'-phosphodiesterase (5'-nucleotidase family)
MHGEVGLSLSGHWQTGLPAGPITVGAVYDACRSTANPGCAQLSGAQIPHFLREALTPDNMQKTPAGLRGVPIGMPHVSGIIVRYDPTALDAIEVQINGEALQPDRLYCVAATDLELSDFIGYLTLPDEQVTYELPTIVAEVLEDYIAQHTPIGQFDQRFFLVGD